ncbi:MAG: DNA-3-methyladenine glycosylase, partial [Gemmatimonadota bacterium]|nr:DNA-3-methyladenine glycosylase [Gemmatimonadota bacterium]
MGTAPRRRPVLPASFFSRDTVSVARELLGSIIETKIRGAVTSGRIVEVEAYTGPDDPASHAANWRRTERNEAMYGPPGIAYVYKSYGIH